MSDTLSNIQTDARFFADDSVVDLTTGLGLRIANLVYQRMCNMRRWPELIRVDTSLSTTSGTDSYTWVTSPVFKEEPLIEIQESSGSSDYCIISRCPDEHTWTQIKNSGNSFPVYYRKINESGTVKIVFGPTPNVSSLTIRITGLIEATEFSGGASTTVFLEKNSDRALSMLIAAEYQEKRGFRDESTLLRRQAMSLIPTVNHQPSYESGQIAAHYL